MPPPLNELKARWFINFDPNHFPPSNRRTEVSDSTDGNLVDPLIDGEAYMVTWHQSIVDILGGLPEDDDRRHSEVYHAAFQLEGVHTLGYPEPDSNALDVLVSAHKEHLQIFPLICRNIGSLPVNVPTLYHLMTNDFELDGILNGNERACLDLRFPLIGGNHQKFTVFKNHAEPQDPWAIIGSIDINNPRWDTPEHLPEHPDDPDTRWRQPAIPSGTCGPTHDLGMLVQGPAVRDLEFTFRQRWNDPSRNIGLVRRFASSGGPWAIGLPIGLSGPPPEILEPPLPPLNNRGSHSVQVLHTYGRVSTNQAQRGHSYSWADTGEFTIWASYLNAIQQARHYIYIEDQFFFPFDWPPCYERQGNARNSDLIYRLGEAIEQRGVKVAVLVPANSDIPDWWPVRARTTVYYQRDIGINYLMDKAASSGGDFAVASLNQLDEEGHVIPIFVHSKIMICDDEFVLTGSANFNQRGMAYDGELDIAIVDEANEFARNLRKQLWREHLEREIPDNYVEAYELFKEGATDGSGRLRPYIPTADRSHPPAQHGIKLRGPFPIPIDPYAGPQRTMP